MLQVLDSVETTPAEVTVWPLVNQIEMTPVLVSRHNMSGKPSPLKSPSPCTTKLDVTVPSPFDVTTWPFCTPHSAISPDVSRQKMLPLVSPTMLQVPGGTEPRTAVPDTLVPFMNHTDTVPPEVSYQSRSPLPSLLRSAAPASVNVVGTPATAAACETEVPFISHIEIVPLVSRHRRSALPSPLKSCWPTIDKLLGTVPSPADC